MQAFYPFLTLISMIAFALLAWRLARARGRTVLGWSLAGAVFPPLLLVLYALGPAAPDPGTDGR